MIKIGEDMIKSIGEKILGIIFFCGGIYMVVSNNYSETLIVFLSVFSLFYWWTKE